METQEETLCCSDNFETLEENYNGNFWCLRLYKTNHKQSLINVMDYQKLLETQSDF